MNDINEIFEDTPSAAHGSEEQWISLSDLMTSLMLIFMLLAIAYMLKTQASAQQMMEYSAKAQHDAEQREKDAEKIKKIAQVYDKVKNEMYQDLNREFQADFTAWGATLDKDLSIRFDNQYILFNRGETQLKESFKSILDSFFPRYLGIITSAKYRDVIQEIRIEGHTSSIWSAGTSPQEGYFKNMELSQARTRSALRFIMEMPEAQGELLWLRKYVTANGLSSSRPVFNSDGSENEALSQRVEFRIRTDAETEINSILQSSAPLTP